jgi:hypothetical protein
MPNYSTQPNTNEGRGNIRSRKPKKHKSQPHAKPHKPKAKNAPSWKNQPLFPGGLKTKGEFDRERTGAVNQKFGDVDQEIRQEEGAIPGWYNDYLNKLQGLQTQTTSQFEGLKSQASTLAEAVHSGTPEAQAAADSRNNIVKAIQGALLQQQGAAGTRNTEMAGVATGRMIQRKDELAATKRKVATDKGDFKATYTAEGKQTEFENALAAKQFGLKVEDAKTERIKANKAPKAESTYDKEFSKQAAKYGRTKHDWALLGPTGRARIIQEEAARSGKPPKSLKRIEKEENIKQAARHGYSAEDWAALPPNKRSAIIRGGNKKDKNDAKDKGTEHTWAPPGTQNKGASQSSKLMPAIQDFYKKKIPRHKAARTILKSAENPDNPALVSAALDAVYDKHLSRETARKLQAAGYKATSIARSLGTDTFTEWRRKAKNTGAARTGGN